MIRNGEFTYTAWDRTEVISGMLCFTLFHCGRWGDSLSCDMEINATSTDLHQTLTDYIIAHRITFDACCSVLVVSL